MMPAPTHPVWFELQAAMGRLDELVRPIVDALAPWAPVVVWGAVFVAAALVLRELYARRHDATTDATEPRGKERLTRLRRTPPHEASAPPNPR